MTQLVDPQTGKQEGSADLDAEERGAYVVLRVGLEKERKNKKNEESKDEQEQYSEDLVVFPQAADSRASSLAGRVVERIESFAHALLR